ncbi:hypothetical protein B0P06_005076 [Clostridium saccharoperbutylacetonicum]|uniref:Uncharacterized protein n=1 Tax=Clostridium saccharoperbutylacetonicum N1-4(HMT) TaxID=931276 RepID=M1MFG0_9CLOT|nr:DUF1062 domain-containing protein [Clostridium saccharoperbutylacetonicum]AGF56649.1 hypothetical protein Cspa_c28860 [Clostridium saccharoperbutylacetonicum N1-4(HMT)]NRT62599.1 hypothetical protein [Clostridium saccharoperbutylacetonicum]NSB25947.1 hypothetical protein [Clostridium saccharoperbutylacetonicum]NSB45305.1 hypothetical protein [Clostridium saccharoperbutylacetonicum]
MSYLKKYEWELIPKNLPLVKRNCPKCNEKAHYINSEKFRVNANKNNIDIWLIYQCKKCKSTFNMPIYERTKPSDINKDDYEKFLSNDKMLVREYAFNLSIYNKNKAEIFLEDVGYEVIQKELKAHSVNKNELIIEIVCKYPIELRLDRLLSDRLGVSRSQIKKMHEKEMIFIKDDKNSLNTKVKNEMEIHIVRSPENKDMLQAIVV